MRTNGPLAPAVCVAASAIALLSASASSGASKGIRDHPPPARMASLRGRIAYGTSSGDIWVQNANGSCRHQVTRSGAKTDYDPSWSPDGRRLVFSTDRGRSHSDETRAGLDSMFVVDVEGSHTHEIEPRSGATFPDWSPRGNKIAFAGLRPTGQEMTIYTIDPDGTGLRDLGLTGGAAEPIWAPDGARIAYAAYDRLAAGIWVVGANGGEPRQLTHDASDSPGAWSPSGRELVYSSGQSAQRELYIVSTDGGARRRITNWPGSDSPDAWLTDGRIVFAHSNGERPQAHYYLVRPDGTHIESPALRRQLSSRGRRHGELSRERSSASYPAFCIPQVAGLDVDVAVVVSFDLGAPPEERVGLVDDEDHAAQEAQQALRAMAERATTRGRARLRGDVDLT
jgi:Tol biopolymer transport system component